MLNKEQQEAVNIFEGPVVIRAGAGCGKTLTVSHRVANMIKKGIEPSQILLLTFTKAAADEMKKRVERILNEEGGFASISEMQISTFHSFARKTLMEYIEYSPLKNIKNLKWSDDSLSTWYLNQILTKYLELTKDKKGYERFLKDTANLMRVINDVREDKKKLEDFSKEFRVVYMLYNEHLKTQGKIDFSGSLLYLNELLDVPQVREELSERYKYVIIDEFQDTNKKMFIILIKLTSKYKNLCVVGDENQSIYGFNGSAPEYIINFKEYYKTAKVIMLNENYRSAQQILDASNNLMTYNESSDYNLLHSQSNDGSVFINDFTNAKQQAIQVSERIEEKINNFEKPEDIVVLSRTNKELEYFISIAEKHGFENLYAKRKAKEKNDIAVEHMVMHLKLIYGYLNNNEVFELLSRYNEMFHYALYNLFLKWKRKNKGLGAFDFLGSIEEASGIPLPILRKIRHFYNIIVFIKEKTKLEKEYIIKCLNVISKLADELNGYSKVEEIFGQAKTVTIYCGDKVNKLKKLVENNDLDYSGTFNFFESLDKVMGKEEIPENCVPIMTIHSAKGLEWKHVYMINCFEDSLPHKSSFTEEGVPFYFGNQSKKEYETFLTEIMEEERRLCYVGMTRAKKTLNLCYPVYKYTKSKTSESGWITEKIKPSRFIEEAKRKKYKLSDFID